MQPCFCEYSLPLFPELAGACYGVLGGWLLKTKYSSKDCQAYFLLFKKPSTLLLAQNFYWEAKKSSDINF